MKVTERVLKLADTYKKAVGEHPEYLVLDHESVSILINEIQEDYELYEDFNLEPLEDEVKVIFAGVKILGA